MSAIKVAPKFTPNIASMAFVLKTPGITIEIPLMTPDVLWKHPQFRSDYPTEIIVTGWKTDLDAGPSKSQQALYKAFATRNVNFIVSTVAGSKMTKKTKFFILYHFKLVFNIFLPLFIYFSLLN